MAANLPVDLRSVKLAIPLTVEAAFTLVELWAHPVLAVCGEKDGTDERNDNDCLG